MSPRGHGGRSLPFVRNSTRTREHPRSAVFPETALPNFRSPHTIGEPRSPAELLPRQTRSPRSGAPQGRRPRLMVRAPMGRGYEAGSSAGWMCRRNRCTRGSTSRRGGGGARVTRTIRKRGAQHPRESHVSRETPEVSGPDRHPRDLCVSRGTSGRERTGPPSTRLVRFTWNIRKRGEPLGHSRQAPVPRPTSGSRADRASTPPIAGFTSNIRKRGGPGHSPRRSPVSRETCGGAAPEEHCAATTRAHPVRNTLPAPRDDAARERRAGTGRAERGSRGGLDVRSFRRSATPRRGALSAAAI